MKRFKKRYLFLGIFAVLVAALLFSLSSIVKYELAKNSEKYIHRRITIGELHFDYLKFAARAEEFTLYEDNGTDLFCSFNELYIDFNPWALLSSRYSFSEISLNQPYLSVIQDNEKFNFDSLIPASDSTETPDTLAPKKDIQFIVRNIKIINGKFVYLDKTIGNTIEMDDVGLELPLIAWNNKQSDVGIKFRMGAEGEVSIDARVDNEKGKYTVSMGTKNVSIEPVVYYMKDYLDVTRLQGLATSDVKIEGDMNQVMNVTVSGKVSVAGFSATDGRGAEILTADTVTAEISSINLQKYQFGFSSINLTNPRLSAVLDKDMTNIERLFLPYFINDSIAAAADSIAGTISEEIPATYSIDTLKVVNGAVVFTDNTLNRPFAFNLNQLNMTMAGLTESAGRIPVSFDVNLNGQGKLRGQTAFSLVDPINFEFDGQLEKMDLVNFSPYSEYFIASPITGGKLSYGLQIKMTPTSLTNQNKIRIENLEFGKRTKDTTAMKVPVRLALYMMKDPKGLIKIDLPVSGNPSEPKFKLGKIIWKAFGNLFVKAAAAPFKAIAGLVGNDKDDIGAFLPFDFLQDSLNLEQQTTLVKVADLIKSKPGLLVSFTQQTNPENEKLQLSVIQAKQVFQASETDSTVNTIPENDNPEFRNFISNKVPDIDQLGIEAACLKYIGADVAAEKFNSLVNSRNRFLKTFMNRQGVPDSSIVVSSIDFRNAPEELKKPGYKIEVSLR